jgi:hypothetical protein
LRITDGETRIGEELTAYLDESESILSLTVDNSGNTLLASEHRIVVLDAEDGYRGTVQTDYRITRLVAGGNGGVIARAEGWEGLRILRIDTDRLEITGEIPMDADIADGAMGSDCFAVRKGGIWGVTADWETGTAAERLTMDYAASDHTDAVGLFLYRRRIRLRL